MTNIALFLSAHRFWGDDRNIQRNLLRLADEQGYNFGLYRSLVESLSNNHPISIRHTVIALTVLPNAEVALTIGIVPNIN